MVRTKEEKAEYIKNYHLANKDKIKEQKKVYYLNNKDKIKEQHKVYYLNNNDKLKEYSKTYNLANKDKKKSYVLANKEKISKRSKAYHLANKDKRNAISKTYYLTNKDKSKAYYLANKDKINKRCKAYNLANKDKRKAYVKKYKLVNKDKINEHQKKYNKEKRLNDHMYNMLCRLRCRTRDFFNNNSWTKNHPTLKLLGCNPDQLREHIERQFSKSMTWVNRSKWHLDHIIPLSSAQNKEQAELLCHYTNLQPLWIKDNMIKSNKVPEQQRLSFIIHKEKV